MFFFRYGIIAINTGLQHVLGASAALGSALCWAISAILFRRLGDHMSAAAMTFCKGVIASITLLLLVLLVALPAGLQSGSWQSMLLLAISGIAGISLGDTLYFATLTRLGPRITLILGTLIPVITALAAALIFNESPPAEAWGSLAFILAGIAWVLWLRTPADGQQRQLGSGLLLATGFIIANCIGILLTRSGVSHTGTLEATLYREVAATFTLGLWGVAAAQVSGWVRPLADRRLHAPLLIAALVGTLLGTWLSVVGLKYTWTAVAATLNATSPLFIIPLTFIMHKEPIEGRVIIGASLSVAGIAWYYFAI